MTDRQTGPDRSAPRPLSIDEAAAWLGLSAEGVRSRLRRGQLAGVRHGRTWQVFLTAETGPAGLPVEPDRSDRSTPVPLVPLEQHGDAALVAELRADVLFLRQALEREQVANAELRRLLAVHMPALPAPREMPARPPEKPENGPDVVELVQTPPTPESLAQALKDAGVKKRQRRRLLTRLAAAWRGE